MASNSPQATSTQLGTPRAQPQQRRMTSPADMTRASLTLPDSSNPKPANVRPPSPLRHSIVPNTFTGIDPDDNSSDDDSDSDDDLNGKMYNQHKRNNNYPYQSSSPSSSVSQLAASLAQRVGNFVAGTRLPTDAELEAESKREREKSRREAERILTREAEERRMAEEKILGMKNMGESLPPPPSRSQTISDPPSPSISPKSGGNWWTAAKSRLTPTKEKDPLTPAQQIILEAKAKEKERDKNPKGKEKEWPSHPEAKFNDPSLLNLNVPPAPPSRPIPASPVSPTPSRTQAPLLTPSPMRSISEGGSSPSKETPPIYTQFTPQGTLDVHGTLLTIAKRFEKLEKWTVGHVRALEDRMNDVERWLVEKEKEKEKEGQKESTPSKAEGQSVTVPEPSREMGEIKEELAELQGRVIELGREMARMNSRHSPESPTSCLPPSHMGPAFTTPLQPRLPSTTARESTTPPMVTAKHTGTRLPYPAGDYASPPDNLFSPAHSPPSSVNSATRSRPVAIPTTNNNNTGLESGLPSSTSLSTSYSSTSFSSVSSISSRPLPASPRSGSHSASNSITRVASPTPVSSSHSQEQATLTLPPPPKLPSSSSGSPRGAGAGKRQTSVSPTPRKRYTVALGEPIVSREPQPQAQEPAPPPTAPLTRRTHSRNSSLASTASFMSMMSSAPDDAKSDKGGGEENVNGDDDGMDDEFADETIGKSAALKLTGVVNGGDGGSNGGGGGGGSGGGTAAEPSSEKPNSPSPRTKRRIRPQSAYDFSSFLNSHQQQQVQLQRQQRSSQQSLQSQSSQSSQGSASVAPLRPRWRSHSTDRGDGAGAGGKDDGRTSRFIDPLVLRKQGREMGSKLPMPKPIGKVPVGELVAFFDKDKKA